MDQSKKKRVIILIILAIIFLAIGCTTSFIYDRNITKEKAAEVAIQHIKTRENIDVIVTKIDIKPTFQGGFIEVRGYAENDKKRKFYVTVSKKQNYSIMGWNLDDPQ
ncbi:hypothetical protein C3496_11200 [Bacillus anthracis]|uniref:hypothetical protein n=1 Tax=Bacillus TaxID=1386 RepID=UPI0010A5B2CF|nr:MULTISPECIES: hypothetical protein [Bacillus]MDA1738416.1 hypothetical protein [Bacillus cereus]MDA2035973.1 hypothetical protein [Bacillus cereus]MDA2052481.1 hypothetical protein [Bacillus cereus]QBJ66904.1 hypothetical protein C3496_11200 [Bacillus anthracis]THG62828.1 hypothetical protein E7Y01_03475 [Bacillus sp. HUB-I-004]